ncbi:hypothetical protein ACFX2G_015486 [Malus domestica]
MAPASLFANGGAAAAVEAIPTLPFKIVDSPASSAAGNSEEESAVDKSPHVVELLVEISRESAVVPCQHLTLSRKCRNLTSEKPKAEETN